MSTSYQDEIHDLLQSQEISTETAVRLILKTQADMLQSIEKLTAQTEQIKAYQNSYPSITWLLINRRRDTIFVAFFIFILFSILFNPTATIDLRQLVAAALGIP